MMSFQDMDTYDPKMQSSKMGRKLVLFKGILDLILVAAVVGIFALALRKDIQDHTTTPQSATLQSGAPSAQVEAPQTGQSQFSSTEVSLEKSSSTKPTLRHFQTSKSTLPQSSTKESVLTQTTPTQGTSRLPTSAQTMFPDSTAMKNTLPEATLPNTGSAQTKLPQNGPQQIATRQARHTILKDADVQDGSFMQDCGKESFPDIDYSLFGYDILKGFPLAEGLDPGFTFPIFRADYSMGAHSADCRYSIPQGLVIVPDVSCVTSFTSETITTHREYSKSLSKNFGVEASVFGASFSSSTGYRRASSEIESNEKVYILTTARCNYYNSKVLWLNAPPFDKVFLQWIKRLEGSTSKEVYLKFLDTYGTHVPAEMIFGARYTFENIMTKHEFESKKSRGIDIEMAASVSALISVRGTYKVDKNQEQMVQNFRENITIRTVTVGAAPPPDGDAMKWASSVQSNPVPVYYRLSSIENLFSTYFMEDLGIDYVSIYSNLTEYKRGYEDYLWKKELLTGCMDVDGQYVKLEKTALRDNGPYQERGTLPDCLSVCKNDPTCIGFTMTGDSCDFADGEGPNKSIYAYSFEQSTSYILWKENLNNTIRIQQTFINGIIFRRDQSVSTVSQCEELCSNIDRCFAMTFRESCRLYEKNKVFSFIEDVHSIATIFSKCP